MIWYLHTDYSRPYLCLWILMCLPWIVWEVEEWNGVDFRLLHFPAIWLGFWKYFAKTNHSCTYPWDLSCRSMCMYPHQDIASFHPTSKDGLCGAHGRREKVACTCVTCIAKSNKGSMEMTNQTSWSRLCTYVEGEWWNEILLLWSSLSFIWITWGHGYIYFFPLFFHRHWCVHFFIFFGSCFLGMPSFFFNSPCLIWRILEREIIKHGVLFCGWMEWGS